MDISINIRAPSFLFQLCFDRSVNVAVVANNYYFSTVNPTLIAPPTSKNSDLPVKTQQRWGQRA